MEKPTRNSQRGVSTLGTVILLGVLGYGVFIGLQYIPQKIEDLSVDSVLDSIATIQQQGPYDSGP